MTRTQQPPIPLLSLSDSSPADFLAALSSTGFIHLSLVDPLSPVHPTSVRSAFSLSDALFSDCPVEERAKFPRTEDPDLNGYMALGTTALNREGGQKAGDWKETFGYGRSDVSVDKSPQGLPKPLDERREELEEFHRRCYELMLLILDKVSLAFDVSRSSPVSERVETEG